MKYICLGYLEPGKFENMSESERNTVFDKCFSYNDELRKNGHLLAEEPLQPAKTAVTVNWKNGKVAVTIRFWGCSISWRRRLSIVRLCAPKFGGIVRRPLFVAAALTELTKIGGAAAFAQPTHIRNHCVPAIICCTLALTPACGAQEHTWDYSTLHGPSHWGELAPEFAPCKEGHHQSPIDIRNPHISDLPPIEFHYQPSTLDIIDNGHTIMINYGPGSFMSVGSKKYVLKQFHFHRPSEEKIDGKSYAMSVHLVHADEAGKVAVVAVLLQKGEDNALVHELWKDLPDQKEKEEFLKDVQIDADGLLPADHGYYSFSGSLTTPPCSEDVTWFVLKHPVSVSAAEIEQFAKLYRNDARPTQPLHDRVVLASR